MERKKYIAYGSNLNREQMAERCPTAKVIGTGVIKDYELLFRGRRNSAFATVEPKVGSQVPVLIWEIGKEDEWALNRYEGYPRHYGKENLTVETENGTESIMAYIMQPGFKVGMPSECYLNTIKVGYVEAGFNVNPLLESVEQCQRLLDMKAACDSAEERLWHPQVLC